MSDNVIEWREIAAWATEEIELGRDKLEKPLTGEDDISRLRGRIAALRDLLALPQTLRADPRTHIPEPTYGAGISTSSYNV